MHYRLLQLLLHLTAFSVTIKVFVRSLQKKKKSLYVYLVVEIAVSSLTSTLPRVEEVAHVYA